MKMNLVAVARVSIHASRERVWDALTKPELVKEYMMGAEVKSDWKVGSALTYSGDVQGELFEEKGVIQKFEPMRVLQATHFSARSGKPDEPDNYALVTWDLKEKDGDTVLTVTQDGIESREGVEGSRSNWATILNGLKLTAEGTHTRS